MKAQHFTESIASGVLEAELYKERCRLELRSGGNINQYGGVSKGDFVFNCLFLPLESNRSSNWIVFMQWICIQWILMAWTVLFYPVLSRLLDPSDTFHQWASCSRGPTGRHWVLNQEPFWLGVEPSTRPLLLARWSKCGRNTILNLTFEIKEENVMHCFLTSGNNYNLVPQNVWQQTEKNNG